MFGDWNYINNVSAGLNSGELIAFVKLFAVWKSEQRKLASWLYAKWFYHPIVYI